MALQKPTVIHFDGKKGFADPSDGIFLPDPKGEYHFPKIKQGSTLEFDLSFTDSEGQTVVLTDLTSVGYEADWRQNYGDATPEMTATFSNPDSTTLRVRVEASSTSSLAATADDAKVWDLEISYDDGGAEDHVDRVVMGTYQFTQEASE